MYANGRKNKAIINLIYAWLNQVVIILLNFAIRIIFIKVLSKNYLGINGLFSNIINMLSLAELGIGSAIVFSLYEPLAEKNNELIESIMQFYKKVYHVIGLVIAVLGFSCMPFLQFFIKEMPDIPQLRLIYILFVLNTAVSYFFSYKSSLISADQKDYLVKKIRLICYIVMYVVQAIILLLTKNYILFLMVQLITTLIQNMLYSNKADALYPFIKKHKTRQLPAEVLSQILLNTKSLMFHKIGSAMVFSTDNMIISKYVGLEGVALYSNYTLISQTLDNILVQIFLAMSASVGNLGVLESNEKKLEIFNHVFFINFWIYSFCSITFYCLAQNFIQLCFGRDFLLGNFTLLIIVINFYLTGLRRSVLTFKEAFGLFYQNRFMPLGEAVINLIASLVLVKFIGISGVFLGTLISSILMPIVIEPWVLFKYGFKKNIIIYWKTYFKFNLLTVLFGIITIVLCEKILLESIFLTLLVKGLLCFFVINIGYILLFFKNIEFLYIKSFLLEMRKNNVR